MQCDKAREAISARIDGEDPGCPADELQAHLAECAACREWQQRAHVVTRRARLGGPVLDRDLTATVLAALPPVRPAGRRRERALRAGLAVAALAQLAVTVPLLVLGSDHGADIHAAHELGSFDLALAIAFAVGAIRPQLSSGLAWPCGIAAAGLVITAITDLISGQTMGADEIQHLVAAAGAALLAWQAWTVRTGAAGPGLAAPRSPAVPRQERTQPAAGAVALRPETRSEPGGGGSDVAQGGAQGIAACNGRKTA